MSIRTKGLIGIFIVVMFNFIIVHLTQIVIINPKFEQHSRDVAVKVMKKNIDLLETETENLIDLTQDYAMWNDTYDYVDGKKENYIYDTYHETSLNNLNLSLVTIIDKKGKILFAKFKNDENIWLDIEENSVVDFIKKEKINENFHGFFNIDEEIFLLVGQQIFRTDGSGDANGFVIFGKRLSDFKIFDENNLTFISLDSLKENEFKDITSLFYLDKISYKDNIFVINEESKNYMGVYMIIKDIKEETIGFSKLTSAREVENFVKRVYSIVMLIFALLGVVAIASLNMGFNILVARPIKKLKENIYIFKKQMKNIKNFELYDRDDEISDLAKSIDEFKEEIILRHNELLQINKDLEIKIKERTLELEEKNRELLLSDKIISQTLEAIIVLDDNKNIVKINKALENITGYSNHELLGNNINVLNIISQDNKNIDEILDDTLSYGCWKGEVYGVNKYKIKIPFITSIISLTNKEQVYFIIILTDITEIKNAQEKLKKMAYYDSLTSLPNRVLFYKNLNNSIKRAQKHNTKFALLFLDIDRFKIVNDTLGHEMGDKLLVEVSKRFKENIKIEDAVYRLGGDEFTIILDDINDESSVKDIAINLIMDISLPFYIDNNEVRVGLSIGIAIYPTDDTTIEGLIRKADAALYEVKETKKGTFKFFSNDI
ncbi:PAS domain S-box-containing protein/diguanylate cyclase (GGDEF) domain-containing protein [Alkalithermobacter thermoalcaliphilus JW-YL-7 = DSM 7308]|uniref:Diguanylate cyclase with PAS/PAC sensor n=2 Tax=Clostridium paradoxum TaxID=29346 RepID=A0A150FSU9_CLOPD|nr:diguanylate cyclase with PAS/PAC sensor [[Clostridium] paradoxum JW-YL-7 = DSM 7308]SHK41238.1 PAS domain S-box-containing protein/diguanylate cyclase (GGDEF) domain-containing protein [[Clostridium] paradoxum JW-YL-7 = DSM 7308]